VEDGGRALAEAVAKADKIALAPATPLVVPAGALADYGVCYQILIRQPIGVETPTVLSVPELGQAVKRCRAATEAAPTFDAAWAALGLGLAISGEDAEAVKSLLRVKDKNAWLPLWWLGRCWVVTRHISVEAGADVLGQAVKTHPGFLLARGYLAEHHGALRRADAAYNAWSTYLERVPDSGYIRGRMSSLLAKLGRHDEAIARAREAASRDPAARDAQLELASRQLDACHHADAIALFKPLAAAERPRAEVLLRLGYAQLLSGDLAAAEASLERALKNATHPSEWRTRGHALADLARVYLKRSDSVRAEEMILAARQADLLPVVLAQNDPELKKLVERTSPKPKKLSLDLPRMVKPRELSPFAIDAAGQVDPNQRGFGTPPSSVELLRF
jgi:tetratricopeptide (TPR) repeat protein